MEIHNLKDIRNLIGITQQEAADFLGISLRSFKSYENDISKRSSRKYKYFCEELEKINFIDETHGILSIELIKEIVSNTLKNYNVNFCYLFGSYAKNKAIETSDVDLLIDTEISGLDFFGLVEDLRTNLKKKVDLLKINQLDNNQELLRNVLKDGIKIYG